MTKPVEYNIIRESALQLIEDYLTWIGLKDNDGTYKGVYGEIIKISQNKKRLTIFPDRLKDDKKNLENITWLLENQSEIDILARPTDKLKLLKLNSFLKGHY